MAASEENCKPGPPGESTCVQRTGQLRRQWYALRWLRVQTGRLLRKVAHRHSTPHSIALGTAIGVFIAFTPTVGLQMALGIFVATLVGANRVAAAVPAWITNPVTILPIYTFNYWLGTLFIPSAPRVRAFARKLESILEATKDGSFYDALQELLSLGLHVLLPLWIGSVLVGAVCGLLAYPVMLRCVAAFRRTLERKRAAWERRLRERRDRKEELERNLPF